MTIEAYVEEIELMFYGDPGSGLLMWQILTAGVVGGLFQIRKFLVKLFFRKRD